MANWIISCHGYTEAKSGKRVALTTRQTYENASIPKGVELVTYTEQGDALSMAKGWTLWEQLTGSKEGDAYAAKHKSKVGPKSIVNYGLSGPHDADDYKAWLTKAGGATVSACGLFEVGNPKAFQEFAIGMTAMTLQDALNKAASKGVKRVYYLACQELG